MNAYNRFSTIYDKLMYDCDYDRWSQYLISRVSGKGVDLACGSGKMTIPMKKSGLDVYGVDISADMLKMANENAAKAGVNISFIEGDLVKFPYHKKLDFITCMIDGLNYVGTSKLLAFFKRAYEGLNEGGRLIFDLSSEYKLVEVIGNNFFYEDGEDITYLWTNKLAKSKAFVELELAFFVKEGKSYVRFDESHKLFVHSHEFVLKCLKEVGFEIEEVLDDGFKQYENNKTMRIIYHAVKR